MEVELVKAGAEPLPFVVAMLACGGSCLVQILVDDQSLL